MTGPRNHGADPSAPDDAQGVDVAGECSCDLSKRIPERERWSFTGRETHWGYVYLIWTLQANPTGSRKVGERHARVQW